MRESLSSSMSLLMGSGAAGPAPLAETSPRLHGRKVLLVEDDLGLRSSLAGYLERKGAVVSTAENGRDGIHQLGLADFDLVISDLDMPEINGNELLCWARKNVQTPVLLMTGAPNLIVDRAWYKREEATLLQKPLNTSDLLSAIQHTLEPEAAAPALDRVWFNLAQAAWLGGWAIYFNHQSSLASWPCAAIAVGVPFAARLALIARRLRRG